MAANLLQNRNLYSKQGQVLKTEQLYYKIRQAFKYEPFITQKGILVFLITLIIYFKTLIMRKLDYKK